MNGNKLKWKKHRWNGLPALWDGEATWCLILGPLAAAGGRARICRLSSYPPTEPPHKFIEFYLHVEDEGLAREILCQLAVAAKHCLAAQIGLSYLEDAGLVSNRYCEERYPH